MPKVYFAADHAGFALKNALIEHVRTRGYEVEDLGALSFDADDDYPDFMMPLAERVAAEPGACGVIVGGSGQGEAMCANRIRGVRAAVFYGPCRDVLRPDMMNTDIVKLAREHNDANVLSIGARFVSGEDADLAVRIFLETPFSASTRHARRLAKF